MSDTWWIDEGELLEEQLEVLGKDLNIDLLLSGPPGSGKTNLLLLRANHLFLSQPGSEFYIICFTSLLQKFIRTGSSIYSFPENRIITQMKLFEQVLGDHGKLPRRTVGCTYKEREAQLKSAMVSLMSDGLAKESFPILLIDEAQDYSKLDFSIFKHLAKNISCAGDIRQEIYDTGKNSKSWMEEHEWHDSVNLKYHHRVAPAILEVADKIMLGKFHHQPMIGTHQYKGEPGFVEVLGGLDLEKQINTAAPKIEKQLNVYPGKLIGILIPLKDQINEVYEKLSAIPGLTGKVTNAMSSEFNPSLPIWVSTVHSSKGLEFRSVHIFAADTFSEFREHERRVAFMAVTRAKTALNIYHNAPLHAFFASALAKPNTKKVSLGNIFGKK